MAVLKIKRGATSQIVDVWIGDSTSTTGAGKTGITWNAAGLTLKYQESDAASGTSATLASMTEGTWTSGGFVESNIGQGWYQIGIPNAAIDSGTRTKFVVYGATGMVTTPFYIELDAIDYQDSVRAGLTALPSAAADAAGGLPISDAGGLDLDNRMPAAAAITNLNTVFNTDFASNYNTTADKWKVDVTHASGTAVTATGGRLEVDTTHWGGVAVGLAVIQADLDTIKGQSITCAAPVTFGVYVGGTGAAALETTAQDILTDTAEIGAAGAGLTALASATDLATVDTVADAIKVVTDQFVFTVANQVDANALSGGGGGVSEATLTKYIALLARKDSAIATDLATELGNINQDFGTGTGTYANASDALEALRDQGDSAWITATGFSTHTAADVATAFGFTGSLDTLLADLPTVSEFEARTLPSADYFDWTTDTVANVTTVATLTGHTPQTGDAYAVVVDGTYGNSALKTLVDDLPTNSESQAMFDALNQSAARRVMLATSLQWETPESGSNTYKIQLRTYDGDGALADADSTPSLTATGQVSGSLNANLSSATNPSTGVYVWTYTLASGSTSEQVQLDASATIGGTAFTASSFPVIADFVAATFTTSDRTKIEAVYDKLPSKNYLAGTANSDGDIQLDEATGTPADSAGVTTLLARIPASMIVRSNTAQSGSTSTTIKLDASASASTNFYRGATILVTGGTGFGQSARTITGYNGTTKIATLDRAWITTPDNTSTFAIFGTNSPSLNTNLQVSTAAASATIRTGTAQSGSTSNTIKLDAGASSTNNVYYGNTISVTSGTGLGQTRTIVSYNGTTKVATIAPNWVTTPDNTSVFAIVANTTPTQFSDQGVAQAGTTGSITLASTASATDDIYNGSWITIMSGTAAGETSEIADYDGTTKVATVSPSFGGAPDSTSAYAVIPTRGSETPQAIPTAAEIRAEIDANSTQLAKLGTPAGASMSADIAAVKAETASILDDTGTAGVVVAAASKSGYALSATGLDAITAGGVTLTVAAFRSAAVLTGTVTGAGTGTEIFTGYGMTVTVSATAAGNRTSVVYA